MIVTVTMNPAIDKTVYIDELLPGATHRTAQGEVDYGGKGINVAKVLTGLGSECRAIGLMPSGGSEQMFKSLEEAGVSHKFCMVSGQIRTNTKLVEINGRLTEINEPGCEVSVEELEQFYRKFTDVGKATVVLTGSIPKGVPKECYAHIIEMVKAQGGKVLLDADGEVLHHAMKKNPDIVKINESEFQKLTEIIPEYRTLSESQICGMLIERGIKEIIITRGEEGVTYYSKTEHLDIPAMKVKVSSTVGAGDTFGAAYLYAREQNKKVKEALCYAVAASAASVETMGTKAPDKERIEELYRSHFLNIN